MRVLVTGGSGFIAGHCILQLLEQGYLVRTTVRSLSREAEVRAQLGAGEALSFVAADLTADEGWDEAVAGCDYVLHVASPVHLGAVKDENEVIGPAREGALRVLRAARDAGVRRVVLTSAFHAAGWGHGRVDREFTEDDWTVLDGPGVDAYGRSKTLAERAAWDFAAANGLELTTVLPVAVMGPVLGRDISGANHVVQRCLSGAMPGYPDLWFPIVDVRDVAAAHLLAMVTPEAAGQRFLLAAGPAIPMKQVGAILRKHLGDAAGKVPARSIPDVVVRLAALFRPEFRAVVPDLGVARRVSSERARTVLGWTARPVEEAVAAAGRSMVGGKLLGSAAGG